MATTAMSEYEDLMKHARENDNSGGWMLARSPDVLVRVRNQEAYFSTARALRQNIGTPCSGTGSVHRADDWCVVLNVM